MNLHHYYVMFEAERNSVITGLASASCLVQLIHEMQQICKQRQRYFLNFFNLIQVTTISMNIYCISIAMLTT